MEKIKRMALFGVVLILALIGVLIPNSTNVSAATPVTLSISPINNNMEIGADFWVNVKMSQVVDLNSYQFDISYDPSVIQIQGQEGGSDVVGGVITDTSTIPSTVTNYPITWRFTVTGTQGEITIIGSLPLHNVAKGSGVAARIHFRVVGTYGGQSAIIPNDISLRNRYNLPITLSTPGQGIVRILYPPVTVSIDAPANLTVGGRFTARVDVSLVSDLQAFQFDITYNPNVIRIIGPESEAEGVTAGLIDFTPIPISWWSYVPFGSPGTIRVIGNVLDTLDEGVNSATGIGHLADFNFEVVGALGSSTPLTFTTTSNFNNVLFNSTGSSINAVTWTNTLCRVNNNCSITTNSPLPLGEESVPYSTNLSAWGGTPPYVWSDNGNLPAGLSLDPSTGVLSGTPSTSFGPDTVTIGVTDQAGSTTNKDFLLRIIAAPEITTSSLKVGEIGLPYTQDLQATGGVPPYQWDIVSGAIPPGLILDPSSGQISGTPSGNGTTVTLTFSVIDSFGGSSQKSLPITILIEPTITTNSPLPTGEVGKAYSKTLTFLGGTPPIRWSIPAGALPQGLTLNAATGLISGTPTRVTSPTILTFRATESTGRSAIKQLSIAVVAKPVITTTALPGMEVGSIYTANVAYAGGVGPFIWSIKSGALPSGLTINRNSGVISGVPTRAATYIFTVMVLDSLGGTDDQALTIIVRPAPVISTTSLADGEMGSIYSKTLTATGGITPYTWSITSGSLPGGLTLNSTTGGISGRSTSSGTYAITFKVTDKVGGSSTRNLSISMNAGPVITTTALIEGELRLAYKQVLTATGGTLPYKWTITSGSMPTGLLLSTTGVISGKSTAPVINKSVTIKVTSALGSSSSKTFLITIFKAPVITTTSLAKGETGASYSQTLKGADGKPPYTWSISYGILPTGLILNPATGMISGTPTKVYPAKTITFKLTDSLGGFITRSISMAVVAGPSITNNALANGEVGFAYTQYLFVTGGVSPYTWSLVSGPLPEGLTFNPVTAVISGKPAKAGGPYLLSFRVVDRAGGAETKTFSMSICLAPTITTSSLNNGEVGRKYYAQLAVTQGLNPYKWAILSGKLPPGLLLNTTTGVISGTPTSIYGPVQVVFKVTDAVGVSSTANLSMRIVAAPVITTTSPLPTGEIGISYSRNLAAINGVPPYKWSVQSGTLPRGLTLNSSTGLISGTPEVTTAGNTIIFKLVDNLGGTATKSLLLKVAGAPQISTTALVNGRAGLAYLQTLKAENGVPAYSWSIVSGILPTGLNLNSATGVLSGKPVSRVGPVAITFKVTDSLGGSTLKTLLITIS